MNYDDWKLSPPDGDELLSPCCGCTYTETDESYECDSCKEEFDEPIVDYEYRARIADDRAEAMMEDRRLGL